MTIESGEYKSSIGLDSLYIAEVTADSIAAYTAGTPEVLAPAAEANMTPSSSTAVQYADDVPYDVIYSEYESKITMKVTGIPLSILAAINGRVFDAASGRMFDNIGVAPYYALMFRSLKSNGSYRYYSYLKGRFDMPKDDFATKGETPEPKTVELVYTAVPTIYQFDLGDIGGSVKRVIGDEDTTNFSGTTWFSQVQTPVSVAPDPLALSSSTPTDGQNGVSITANQTLTFNNALVNANGVTLFKSSDGSKIASAVTLDPTSKIVTINPDASLSGTTDYLLVFAAVDIYGQTLNDSIEFTTA